MRSTTGWTRILARVDQRPRGVRAAVVGAVVALLLAAWSAPAGAHAALFDAQPEPGAELASAPGVVELEFDEPLIADLSTATVTDPDGERWTGEVVGESEIHVGLQTTAPGLYVVEWKTVSPLDGHTLRGSYTFGVGVDPGEVDDFEPAPSSADLAVAVPRAVEYAALLVAIGMLLLRRLAAREPRLAWAQPDVRWPLAVALAAGALVVAGEGLLAGGTASGLVSYLRAEPGAVRLWRLGLVAIALVASASPVRWAAPVALAGAIAALSAAGHAAAAQPFWWAVTVNTVHLLAAGLWAGAIGASVFLRPPEGWRGAQARELLRRFSPVAIPAFVATVAFGTLRGTQELTGLGDLVRTYYGQVLTMKVLAVAVMVPLSWRAWRRGDARPRAETVLAAAAVTLAALLAAFPLPPQRAAETADPGGAVDDEALPVQGDLTLGGDTGDVLVGLTVRPGEPGRNQVLVHLLSTGGVEAAGGLDVGLTVDGEQVPVETCGPTCRSADSSFRGGETVTVRVAGVDDEPATFQLPDLPAPSGRQLLARLTERMNALETYRYDEVLGPADPPITSEWAIQAPDRLWGVVYDRHTGEVARETVRIADRKYNRSGPDDDWSSGETVELNVPRHIWDYPDPVGIRIVGTDELDGRQLTILSFFIDHLSGPIWYRLWVDDDHLVHRAEMRARGHFMDHDYHDHDEPFTIDAPQ